MHESVADVEAQSVALIVSVKAATDAATRHELMDEVRRSGAARAISGPSAAASQDFLYDTDGLPG